MKNYKIILSGIFVFLVILNGSCQDNKKAQAVVQHVNSNEFKQLIDNKTGVLLDVRTPEEYAEGHIPGAINIDFQSDNFNQEIEKLDKSKQYNVYCRSGHRSGLAAEKMEKSNFTKVVDLEGGILGWKEKGFAVEH